MSAPGLALPVVTMMLMLKPLAQEDSLEGNNLSGIIPPDLALLKSLTLLDLSANSEVRGSLPSVDWESSSFECSCVWTHAG